ncbi:MAG: LysR family transcriptional regulator [Thermus sp.]|nr:LysR family transcriptional regulator [Thermus sp.]MCS6869657.1 LysR family transcriptional regulator [Thermus sp.]
MREVQVLSVSTSSIAVVESGLISRTLASLNVSQYVVTNAIRKLEATIGVELLIRHTWGMTLIQCRCRPPVPASCA